MTSLQTIDRTLFELLRLVAVQGGYLPNFRGMAGNTLEEKQANYETAKGQMTGPIVEVFSIGSAESKRAETTHRIVLNRKAIQPGTIGAKSVTKYSKNQNGTFKKTQYPERTSTIPYEIRIITNKTEVERNLSTGILNSLGMDREIKSVNTAWNFVGENIHLIHTGAVNVSGTDSIEWIYNYIVKDAWILEETILNDSVPALTTINIKTYIDFEPQNTLVGEINVS